jgi:hypothetical protein
MKVSALFGIGFNGWEIMKMAKPRCSKLRHTAAMIEANNLLS